MPDLEHAVTAPRGGPDRAWELFVSEAPDDPPRHAGSVRAPTAAVAREQADQLFGDAAVRLWLCPAEETHRFQASEQALGPTDADGDGADEPTMDAAAMAAETMQGDGG